MIRRDDAWKDMPKAEVIMKKQCREAYEEEKRIYK